MLLAGNFGANLDTSFDTNLDTSFDTSFDTSLDTSFDTNLDTSLDASFDAGLSRRGRAVDGLLEDRGGDVNLPLTGTEREQRVGD